MWTLLQVLIGVFLSVQGASIIQPDWGYYFDQDDQGPGTYSWGYDIEDASTRNVQFRRERRLPNGTVTGSYGLVEPDGNIKIVHYTADTQGYRVVIENSLRGDESHPLPTPPGPKWGLNPSPPIWDLLWNPPPRDHRQHSPTLTHALQSLETLGSPLQEERTPPVYRDRSPDPMDTQEADQSPSYPVYLPPPRQQV
ncbi:uncharacterized protein LOC128988100 [Macrosteles quadrilineatus]|uniref:uncharacterized protein LOC128988100 n=1 Tax=Macrosteles quadrilineatus TaxID=74068 RepID=UPI0023E2B3E7|nr:uncharacterized protein LOC128988100 [Macrosteles quadrilineatus]